MAAITASAAGGFWNAGASWEGGVEPKEGDDVILAEGSGSITITAEAKCRSCDALNYKKTLKIEAIWKIGTTTSNAGLCLRLGAGMTLVHPELEAKRIEFVSTAAEVQKITTAGKKMGYTKFTGTGATWQLQDAVEWGSIWELTAGTFETNNFNMSNPQAADNRLKLEGGSFKAGSSTIKINANNEGWRAAGGVFKAETSTVELLGAQTGEVINSTFYNLVFAKGGIVFNTCTIENEWRINTKGEAGTKLVGGCTITLNGTFATNGTAAEPAILSIGPKAGFTTQWKLKRTSGTLEPIGVAFQGCKVEGGFQLIVRGVGGSDKGGNTGIFFDEDSLKATHADLGAVSDLGSRF